MISTAVLRDATHWDDVIMRLGHEHLRRPDLRHTGLTWMAFQMVPGSPLSSHFPTEQAALKCLYLVTRSLDPTGTGRARWTMRWKPALNAFAITFGDRFPAAETY
jgi:hypothetical protein